MSDEVQARIAKFRMMVEGTPNDPLGHYSLGRALFESGQFAEAAASFSRVLELDPNISRVYQLLADAQLRLDQKDAAIETLRKGATIAHQRGDMMPRKEILAKLAEFGIDMPELQQVQRNVEVGEGKVLCACCGLVKPKMLRQPFKTAIGREIFERICNDCFQSWIPQGTKVINELRLAMTDPQAQKIYDQHMLEYLKLR